MRRSSCLLIDNRYILPVSRASEAPRAACTYEVRGKNWFRGWGGCLTFASFNFDDAKKLDPLRCCCSTRPNAIKKESPPTTFFFLVCHISGGARHLFFFLLLFCFFVFFVIFSVIALSTLLTALQCNISVSWFCDHRACISLGGRIGADTRCAGSRRVKRTVSCEKHIGRRDAAHHHQRTQVNGSF